MNNFEMIVGKLTNYSFNLDDLDINILKECQIEAYKIVDKMNSYGRSRSTMINHIKRVY